MSPLTFQIILLANKVCLLIQENKCGHPATPTTPVLRILEAGNSRQDKHSKPHE